MASRRTDKDSSCTLWHHTNTHTNTHSSISAVWWLSLSKIPPKWKSGDSALASITPKSPSFHCVPKGETCFDKGEIGSGMLFAHCEQRRCQQRCCLTNFALQFCRIGLERTLKTEERLSSFNFRKYFDCLQSKKLFLICSSFGLQESCQAKLDEQVSLLCLHWPHTHLPDKCYPRLLHGK